MNINGLIYVFAEVNKGVKYFRSSIGSKNTSEDGSVSYDNMRVDIRFEKEAFPAEKLDKMKVDTAYKVEVSEGFLTCRKFVDKNGEKRYIPLIVIKAAKVLSSKKVEKRTTTQDSDLPF